MEKDHRASLMGCNERAAGRAGTRWKVGTVAVLALYPATLACERQHGLAVKTWLDDAAPCAPVGDYEYVRISARECPIQHYYSTPDVQSVQECAWACDEQPSCVGFAWGVPFGAIAPMQSCGLTDSCVAGSRYLRPAKDGTRTSYFKLPRDSHFRNGVPVPSVHQDGTVLSSETTGYFSSESTGGQLAYRADDTPTEGECIVGDSEDLDEVRVRLFESQIGPRSIEEATCLRECAVYPGATGCLTHSTEGCFVYTSTSIAWRTLDAQQPAQRCWIFWRGGDVDAGSVLRVHQVTGELRAPVSGVYRFQLNSDASLLTGLRVIKSLQQDQDPCSGGLESIGGGRIDFGPYEANMDCEWTVQCPGGSATIAFTSFDTNQSSDFVAVDGVQFSGSYDHAFGTSDQRGGALFSISGSSSMTITFSSDNSSTRGGFSADVTCSGGQYGTAFGGSTITRSAEQGELLAVTATVKQCHGPRFFQWAVSSQPSCAAGLAEHVGVGLQCEPISASATCELAATMLGLDLADLHDTECSVGATFLCQCTERATSSTAARSWSLNVTYPNGATLVPNSFHFGYGIYPRLGSSVDSPNGSRSQCSIPAPLMLESPDAASLASFSRGLGDSASLLSTSLARVDGAWIENSDPCTGWASSIGWYGVTCEQRPLDPARGRIISLRIPRFGLRGNIDSLSSLTELRELNLADNNFSGNLDMLGSLTKLTELRLERNSIIGELGALSQMRELHILDLQHNPLVTGSLEAIAGLDKLEMLRLNSNSQVHGSLGDLSNLSALRRLSLASIGVTGSLDSLAHLPTLEFVDLRNNSVIGSLSVPGSLKSIRQLMVDGNSELEQQTVVSASASSQDCSQEQDETTSCWTNGPNSYISRCPPNTRVYSYSCEPCQPGTTSNGGEITAEDTVCNPIYCRADEHVQDHVCVPCPSGGTHEAGADASAADTTCCFPRTCADTNADGTEDDPYNCDQHANSLTADPSGTNCAGDACVDDDCCTVPPACSGGVELTGGESIDFGPYEANLACEWTVQCPGGIATIAFTSFATESSFDFVTVDGVRYSGSYNQAFGVADQFSISGGSSMAVNFTSDATVNAAGFSADVTCAPAVCDTLWDQGVHACPEASYTYSSVQYVRIADHTTCATHYFQERGNNVNSVAKCAQKCEQNNCAFFTLFQDPSGTNGDYAGTGHSAYCRLHSECEVATRIDPTREDSTVGPAPDGSAGSGGEDLTSPVGVPCWLYQRTEG